MWGHISKPVSIISLLNVFRRFWLTVPSDNLNTGKSTLALKLRLKMYCLDLSDFFPLFPPNSIQKLQKKKSVSNGNEFKKCMQHRKGRLYISTTQRYISLKSDQLTQAVELLWWASRPEGTFNQIVAKGSFEPRVLDAALNTNVTFS